MKRWIVLAAAFATLACGAESGGEFENTVPQGYEQGTQTPENQPTQNEGRYGADEDWYDSEACDTFTDPCVRCVCVAGSESAAAEQCLQECT